MEVYKVCIAVIVLFSENMDENLLLPINFRNNIIFVRGISTLTDVLNTVT